MSDDLFLILIFTVVLILSVVISFIAGRKVYKPSSSTIDLDNPHDVSESLAVLQSHMNILNRKMDDRDTEEKLAILQSNLLSLNQKVDQYVTISSRKQGESDYLIRQINDEMLKMSYVMVDKRARGAWGEFQLKQLICDYLGNSSSVVEYQYVLSNGKRVDAAIHIPQSRKILAIDSKFPLENYRKMREYERDLGSIEYQTARKFFIRDVKCHIDKISQDYSISSESFGDAIMFIPSEAIYIEVCSCQEDILNYALGNQVILASPTTLVGAISTICRMTHEYEMRQNMESMIEELRLIGQEASRLEERAKKLEAHQNQLVQDIHNVSITAHKISQRINNL